jgi:hypothetical protein
MSRFTFLSWRKQRRKAEPMQYLDAQDYRYWRLFMYDHFGG